MRLENGSAVFFLCAGALTLIFSAKVESNCDKVPVGGRQLHGAFPDPKPPLAASFDFPNEDSFLAPRAAAACRATCS